MFIFELVITLLLVGAVLSLLARRIGVPYPALLALAGAASRDPAFHARSFGTGVLAPAAQIWRPTAVRTFFASPGGRYS